MGPNDEPFPSGLVSWGDHEAGLHLGLCWFYRRRYAEDEDEIDPGIAANPSIFVAPKDQLAYAPVHGELTHRY